MLYYAMPVLLLAVVQCDDIGSGGASTEPKRGVTVMGW